MTNILDRPRQSAVYGASFDRDREKVSREAVITTPHGKPKDRNKILIGEFGASLSLFVQKLYDHLGMPLVGKLVLPYATVTTQPGVLNIYAMN